MGPLFELACHEGNYALTDVLARWFRRAVRTRYGPGQLNPPSSGAVRETAPAVGQPVFAERRMGHHYRDGKRMALCGRMAYGSWFDEPERWGRLPSSEQCGHCRAALRRMGGVDGYMREALEARRAADEAEIAELTTLLDEVRSFARRVPVETRRQLAYQLRKAKQEIA